MMSCLKVGDSLAVLKCSVVGNDLESKAIREPQRFFVSFFQKK